MVQVVGLLEIGPYQRTDIWRCPKEGMEPFMLRSFTSLMRKPSVRNSFHPKIVKKIRVRLRHFRATIE